MSVALISIQFNDDFTGFGGPISLRANASVGVPIPEWTVATPPLASASPVAYAIAQLGTRPLTLRAQFSRTEASLREVEVRAIGLERAELPWWQLYLAPPEQLWPLSPPFQSAQDYAAYLSYRAQYDIWSASVAQGNVLGEVKPTRVRFDSQGMSVATRFELSEVRLRSRGVGVFDVAWRWQYRIPGASGWNDLGVTQHRVYSLLSLPTAPWVVGPPDIRNLALPWTEVLDVACTWAARSNTPSQAAASITQRLFELGPELFEYGCPIGALTMYSFPEFNCSAFLQRLRGGYGNGPYVNCTDCATIVTTFANVLGCNLWESRMGLYDPAFLCNPILAIGSDRWQSPCGWNLGFTYHEVAWTDACTANDRVYDACLLVDGDAQPFGPPVPVLAANLQFGLPGQGLYRDLLAAPGQSRLFCEPRPAERTRRLFY